jgi:methylenetetrahydrofolate reductase (NADPH)
MPPADGEGRLRAALRSGRTVVTAEIGPPRNPDPSSIERKAGYMRGWVDAVNLTDSQGALVKVSSFASSLIARAAGVEPVMQLTCRDRNRIALQSDLLAAAAMGLPNVLMLTGDHPKFGDHPEAKPVFDMDSVQLLMTARRMRDQGTLLSGGQPLDPAPNWLIGAVENPAAPPQRFRAQRLGKKVAAGAEFVQTQLTFDVAVLERWMSEVRDLGLDRRCAVLAGVGPIRSLRALEHLQKNIPGIDIPEPIERRLRGVPADRVAEEGVRICVETIKQLTEVPGVAGIHLMAFGFERGIPEMLEQAGIGPREGVTAAAGGD